MTPSQEAMHHALTVRLRREQAEVDRLRYQFSQAKMAAKQTSDRIEQLESEV